MAVKVFDEIHDKDREEAWTLYYEAFKDLNAMAVQRHLMHRDEFDAVMTDVRVRKYLAVDIDGDRPALRGLSTFTDDLAAVDLISPEYFERRWPQLYADRKIWYCGFVCVPPGPRGMPSDAYAQLVGAMYKVAHEGKGIIALDFCAHNGEVRRMRSAIPAMLGHIDPGMDAERLDVQEYWMYTPTTAGGS